MTERDVPPVLAELFKLLPQPGQSFPLEQRANFLQAAAGLIGMLYEPKASFSVQIAAEACATHGENGPSK